jgi:hypothetical protein
VADQDPPSNSKSNPKARTLRIGGSRSALQQQIQLPDWKDKSRPKAFSKSSQANQKTVVRQG